MTRFSPQWLQAGSYAASVDRRLIGALWPAPASTGCAVTAAGGMVINVAAGQVAVPTQNNTGSTLCSSDANEQVTVTAAPAGGTNRIDLIICRPRGNDLDGGANNDFIFDVVTGTAAASPAVPATPAGTVALAQIAVAGGSAAITQGNITDVRPGQLSVPAPAPVVTVPAQATGSVSTTFANATASPNQVISFPAGRFSAAPKVFVNVNSNGSFWGTASAVSATGATLRAFTGTASTATVQIDWYATAAT